jgi:hypothetical protein
MRDGLKIYGNKLAFPDRQTTGNQSQEFKQKSNST